MQRVPLRSLYEHYQILITTTDTQKSANDNDFLPPSLARERKKSQCVCCLSYLVLCFRQNDLNEKKGLQFFTEWFGERLKEAGNNEMTRPYNLSVEWISHTVQCSSLRK